MRRKLALVLLLFSVLWQAFGVAGQATAFADAEEMAHALLHSHGEAHHHHDGTVVQDDSDESRQHAVADGCLGSSAIWVTASFSFAPAATAPPSTSEVTAYPWPPIDGLRRPPRLNA